MTEEELLRLIQQPEGETLDYKSAGYDFPAGRHKFVKDVLALANTPRDGSAFIVFGIDWSASTGSVVVGLGRQLDDAELQSQFPTAKIDPRPRFTYHPLQVQGKQIGVLEVPITQGGPFTAIDDLERVKNTPKIRRGAVYHRHGSTNEVAAGGELSRIHGWFATGQKDVTDLWEKDSWRQFLDGVRRFEAGHSYVLVTDRVRVDPATPFSALGLQQWRAVIDFDPESDAGGLLSHMEPTLKLRRVIHRAVEANDPVRPEPATHWFFARGLAGQRESLHTGNHLTWLKTHKRRLSRQLELVASATSPSPVVALVIWSDSGMSAYLRSVIEELHAAFGEAVQVTVVGETNALAALAHGDGAMFVPMPLRQLCHGLAVESAEQVRSLDSPPVLPSSSGAPTEVPAEEWPWLGEDLELVHLRSGTEGDDDPNDYRIGGEISWRNLNLRHDCERDLGPAVLQRVDQDLRSRQTVRVNLYHAPGAGGTSVGRRVAWELHRTFPVAVLLAVTADATADKIGRVFALTGQSVLVLVDGGNHAERDIDDLYDRLRANNTPVVLLQVLRRFDQQRGGQRQFWLRDGLSAEEADRFRDAYSRVVPDRRGALGALARDEETRSAFFFGLTAFGDDYRGLRQYVEARMPELTEPQRRVLVYLAIAYYYGQQAVPVQAFAPLLGLAPSSTVRFSDAFVGQASRVLGLLVETRGGDWRTSHQLIALEILRRQLAPTAGSTDEMWRQNLSTWGKAFIDFCGADGYAQSDRLLELARRVFIYRDNVEVLGTERAYLKRYSQLIEDIPATQGKVEVLEYLTERFPTEAHFHSHLARLLIQSGEYERSLECSAFAIQLQPDDHVLHHMEGMVYRQQMRTLISAGVGVAEITKLARLAGESFANARRLKPDAEHSYVSEVQMLVSLVDYAGRGKEDVIRDVLAQPTSDPFVRTALERADDLLDQVRQLYGGEDPSRYVQDCRARLAGFFGNYEYALQAWDNLLARRDVYRPPIRRQIVWTLLRRRNSAWATLRSNEVSRARKLLEDNLDEDPNDSTSLRLWLRAVRLAPAMASLDRVIERVTYWKANTNSWDAAYYLYVLHALRALGGSVQAVADTERALEECRTLTRFRRDRRRSFEWLGKGAGIGGLVHQSHLGEWKGDFWADTDALVRIEGRVKSINGPEKGIVEIKGAIDAFFVPGRTGLHDGRDENVAVDCHLGFSYDGPRAWNVQKVG